jgi:hypothetical protein
MPQTTYLPLFRASYPILAPVQKPGGVTVSTTLPAHATPNTVGIKAKSRTQAVAHTPAANGKASKK